MLAAAASTGVFIRFTFAAFVLPIGVAVLHQSLLRTRNAAGVVALTLAAANAVVMAVLLAVVDSTCFGRVSPTLPGIQAALAAFASAVSSAGGGSSLATRIAAAADASGITLAPWNSFQYNADPANLAAHGLHPRWLHAVVNGHIVYGVGWTAVAVYAALVAARWLRGSAQTSVTLRSNQLVVVCFCVVAVGLAVLSAAPHQEPRFLLPLVVPVAVVVAALLDGSTAKQQQQQQAGTPPTTAAGAAAAKPAAAPSRAKGLLSAAFFSVWLLHNTAVGFFYGFAHQGGVLPSVALIGDALAAVRAGRVLDFMQPAAQPPSWAAPMHFSDAFIRRHTVRLVDLAYHGSPPGVGVRIAAVGTYMLPRTLLRLPHWQAAHAAAPGNVTLPWCASADRRAPPPASSAKGKPQKTGLQVVEFGSPRDPGFRQWLAQLGTEHLGAALILFPRALIEDIDHSARSNGLSVRYGASWRPSVSTEHWPKAAGDLNSYALHIAALQSGVDPDAVWTAGEATFAGGAEA